MTRKTGFTLVEFIVAMGLFVVVMAIASGSFISALRSQQAAAALMAANDNASLMLEQMAREFRTGYDFSAAGEDEITFTNADGLVTVYRFNEAEKSVERAAAAAPENLVFRKITGDNVRIVDLKFRVFGDPDFSPRLTVRMSVGAKSARLENVLTNIQTTVSSRIF